MPKYMTDRECLNKLMELLDGPDAVAIAIEAGRIPAESKAQAEVIAFLRRKSRHLKGERLGPDGFHNHHQ